MDSEPNIYRPPPEFEENSSQQLVDLTVSDSTELFLIQWPLHQVNHSVFLIPLRFVYALFFINLNLS